ncbi:MAG: alginate export family protein [Planctomycetota bacterium]
MKRSWRSHDREGCWSNTLRKNLVQEQARSACSWTRTQRVIFSCALFSLLSPALLADPPLPTSVPPPSTVTTPPASPTVEERLTGIEARINAWDRFVKGLSIGGAIRYRGEFKSPADYRLANGNDSEDFNSLRTRLHARFQAEKHFGAFVELQDSRAFGEESPTFLTDDEGVDLRQGHFVFTDLLGLLPSRPTVLEKIDATLRVGREQLPSYGDQRMISPLDWSNIGRAYEGGRATLKFGGAETTADLLWAQLVEDAGINGAGQDAQITGIYAMNRAIPHTELDVYGFWRNFKHQGGATLGEDGIAGDLEDSTFGVRSAFQKHGARASFEFAYQEGKSATDRVDAFGYAGEAGYRLEEKCCPWQPGFAFGHTFASGDDDPVDGNENTFKPIAPFGHSYQGHYDIFAWQNGRDTYFKTLVAPFAAKRATVHADFHWFRLDAQRDAWYDAGGTAIRTASAGNQGRDIGRELDIYVKWASAEKRFAIWTGWSHFWAGNFVRGTGGGGQGDFLFFQMELFFGEKAG